MKNKGFTLIELLGVIIILALLMIIVFPSIVNSVKNSSNKTDDLTKELIYNAADLFIDQHINDFPKMSGSKYSILLSDLVEEGLLTGPIKLSGSDADITNNKCIQVTYQSDYIYELKDSGTCKEIIKYILPSEYKQVEYISGIQPNGTTRTAGIDLNCTWQEVSKINLKMQFLTLSENQYGSMIFKSKTASVESSTPYIYSATNEISFVGIGGSVTNNYTKEQLTNKGTKKLEILINANTDSSNIYFGSWNDVTFSKNWQIEYLKVYNTENKLIRNLVPCYRISDDVIGLYDLIDGNFYTNSGTGVFEKGNNV
ncbi:MAG: prepilin-type N-terminal cleavage/methylation domain-containing protein [Bacilli bacterium]|nr:prepilin-type N-terminal cleavage/methylation domain-containing protein [Bacilli bacterium]